MGPRHRRRPDDVSGMSLATTRRKPLLTVAEKEGAVLKAPSIGLACSADLELDPAMFAIALSRPSRDTYHYGPIISYLTWEDEVTAPSGGMTSNDRTQNRCGRAYLS
jgi:hypothetical protein